MIKKIIFIAHAIKDEKYLERIVDELRKQGIIVMNKEPIISYMGDVGSESNIRILFQSRVRRASIVVILWTEEGQMSQSVNYVAGMANALGKQIIFVVPKNNTPRIPFDVSASQIVKISVDEGEGQLWPISHKLLGRYKLLGRHRLFRRHSSYRKRRKQSRITKQAPSDPPN